MDTAISLQFVGKQKEVSAGDFAKKRNFSKGMFICPECGEDVFLRMGDKQKNSFAHFKRSEIYQDCELRVDGGSNLSIYERLGVPLYLTKSKMHGYELNIGLKAINKDMLESASKAKAYVEIKVGKNSKRINIDHYKFSTDTINLFKINQYPEFNNSFHIQYENLPSSINKWADFIDPVLKAGILFSINSNVGKSIRHGDTIYSDEVYLWLSPKKLNKDDLLEKNTEFDGEIVLNNTTHYIYKVIFIKNEKDLSNIKQLSRELQTRLKVVLLDSKNKINILWPPSIKTEDGYLASAKGRVHNVIESVNSEPDIYMYQDDGYKYPKKLNSTFREGIILLNYNISDNETQLNIDRKITSTGINILYAHHEYNGEDIQLRDRVTTESISTQHHTDDLKFELTTNVKLESLIIDTNKRINTIKHRANSIKWRELNYGNVIYLLNNKNVIAKIHIEQQNHQLSFSYDKIEQLSKASQHTVNLTVQSREKIYRIIEEDVRFNRVFNKILLSNKMPYLIHQLLEEA